MGDDVVVAQAVELFGGHPRLDLGRDEVQGLGGQPAGTAHALEFLGAVDRDPPLLGKGTVGDFALHH